MAVAMGTPRGIVSRMSGRDRITPSQAKRARPLGHWGVKSYENDDAHDALDSAFERVHRQEFEELMDDRNPLTPEQIFRKLADSETLAAALEFLSETFGDDLDAWDEVERLAYVGVVVLHAEAGASIPSATRDRAIDWLEQEPIEWDEPTKRRLRRERELETLKRVGPSAE